MDARVSGLREQRRRSYFARGIAFAVASGICYGLYTAFLTLAETQGVWGEWFAGGEWGAGQPALSAFVVTFVLAALAAGINDLFSGVFSLIVCAKNRQLGDLWKTVKTKPGLVMMLCAAIGGPLATIAYIIGLNAATAAGNPGVIVPIAALNCAIGAVLGRILFKQKLEGHKIVGIAVCLLAAAIIGGTSFASMGPEAALGCLFAFLAAFGWGFEGCVAGFGTILIDYRIGIAIRQVTAGVLELVVMFPLLAVIGGEAALVPGLFSAAIASPALPIFVVSGFFAMPAFSFWYKGNSMCGAALGMACNGMYAFWGPFFIWIVMGVLGIGGMSADYPPLAPVQWVGALVMVAGIFLIAVNPAGLLAGRAGREPGDALVGDGAGGASAPANALPGAGEAGDDWGDSPIVSSETGDNWGDSPIVSSETGDNWGDSPIVPSGGQGDRAPSAPAGRETLDFEQPRAGEAGPEDDSEPLYYAILRCFDDGGAHDAARVVSALEPAYGGYKLLTRKDVEEALATAKENGLLDEVGCDLDADGELRVYYQMSDFGRGMIDRYIGKRSDAAKVRE